MILGRLLKGAGFEVSEACHGRDALAQLAANGTPDLVLVDWNMPEMNGLEFVQAVRADAAYGAMKVMMVTTESEAARVEIAMAAGANEYVMKPFTPDVLKVKLTTLGLAS